MRTLKRLMGAAAAGAALAYFLDPRQGRRRRGVVRDAITSAGHQARDASDTTARDATNRARGLVARVRSLVAGERPSDRQIAERIRAEIGFAVDHPGSIAVGVHGGHVTLTGPVLAHEVEALLDTVESVRGVTGIDNRLTVHAQPGDVPGLEGPPAGPRGRRRRGIMQRVWSPTTRLASGIVGGALTLHAIRRPRFMTSLTGLGGLALLLRSTTDLDLARLFGIGAGPHAVRVDKTIDIGAPVGQVFEQWSRYENFPRLMSHVRDVRRTDGDRWHWVVAGPAGAPVEWEAEQTTFVPNQLIAWRSVPGSLVDQVGSVRFEPTLAGGTRLGVRLSYTPPAGAVGHAIAALFGADPRQAMDDDLARFKSLMEEGKTTAHAETVTRERLAG